MTDTFWVWERVANLEKTDDRDAAQLLKELLEKLIETGPDPEAGFLEIARVVASAMHRVDHRQDSAEDLHAELVADSRHSEELNRFLARMITPEKSDRFPDTPAALQALQPVMADLGSGPVKPVPALSAPPPSKVRSARCSDADPERQRKLALAGFIAIPVILVLLLMGKIISENRQARSPSASTLISGTRVEYLTLQEEGGRYRTAAEWADAERAASSNGDYLQYALSWPDVYREPEVMDSGAWYARRDDGGTEWIELVWNIPVTAECIIVVETGRAGAIVAVDEIQDVRSNSLAAKHYVRLWEGRLTPADGARFALFHLPEARSLAGIRLVLDTASVPGRNRIDGVGLLGSDR